MGSESSRPIHIAAVDSGTTTIGGVAPRGVVSPLPVALEGLRRNDHRGADEGGGDEGGAFPPPTAERVATAGDVPTATTAEEGAAAAVVPSFLDVVTKAMPPAASATCGLDGGMPMVVKPQRELTLDGLSMRHRVLVVGSARSGKSTLVNALLSKDLRCSSWRQLLEPAPVDPPRNEDTTATTTPKITAYSYCAQQCLIDTVGLNDPRFTQDQVINALYGMLYGSEIGYSMIIVVLRHGVFTKADAALLRVYEDIFGRDTFYQRAVLCMTHCDVMAGCDRAAAIASLGEEGTPLTNKSAPLSEAYLSPPHHESFSDAVRRFRPGHVVVGSFAYDENADVDSHLFAPRRAAFRDRVLRVMMAFTPSSASPLAEASPPTAALSKSISPNRGGGGDADSRSCLYETLNCRSILDLIVLLLDRLSYRGKSEAERFRQKFTKYAADALVMVGHVCVICYDDIHPTCLQRHGLRPDAPSSPPRDCGRHGRSQFPDDIGAAAVVANTYAAAVQLPDCGHVYHRDCIKRWLDVPRRTCPHCRALISQRFADLLA